MEGKEWIWDNGIVKEVDIENYYKEIDSQRKDRAQVQLKVWEDFLSKL